MRRIQGMALTALFGVLGLLAGTTFQADEPAKSPRSELAPWQRLLEGEDARKAAEQEKQLLQVESAGKFEESLKIAEALLELRTKAQGADHWESQSARWQLKALQRILQQQKPAQEAYASTFSMNFQAQQLESKSRSREALALRQKELTILRQVLGENHPDTAIGYHNVAFNLNAQGSYAEAEPVFRKALSLKRALLGEQHPSTAAGYNGVAFILNTQGKHAAAEEEFRKALAIRRKVLGEEHRDTTVSYNNLAMNLNAQGKYVEAEKSLQSVVATFRKLLGEEHLDTATGYNNLAFNLSAQGKNERAEEGFRKALAIFRRELGDAHPQTAIGYSNVAATLRAQGRHGEAEEGFRKALAIFRKVLSEEHPDVAQSYLNMAAALNGQGKYAEAEQGFRTALAVSRMALGEEHPRTANAYHGVAYNLSAQGKYAEAEECYRKALDIRRRILGVGHPDTAAGHNGVASNLEAQGRWAAAETGFRMALDIQRKARGEEHPLTASAYNNLASNLNLRGKSVEAEEGYRKALDIRRKVLGEEHPHIADSYNGLAYNLSAQGKHAEAEEEGLKALAICRKALGEEHPRTALAYGNVAFSQNAQGKYDKAQTTWLLAADRFTRARPRIASSGLDRAATTGDAPFLRLAAVLARNGKANAAWDRFEESLSRGTWDDLSARLRRPSAERAKQAQLIAQLDRLDQLVERVVSVKDPTAELTQRLKELLTQQRQAQDALDGFGKELEKTYGPAAGKVSDRATIQATLRDDTALVAWIDRGSAPRSHDPNGEHWAILLRSAGDAVWVRLRGSGPQAAWIDADNRLPSELRDSLHSSQGKWQPLAEQLRKQRLEPLAKHLGATDKLPAVRHLMVLPSATLAGVPVEVFAAGYTVSYAHSGTLLAHIRKQPKPATKGLFALADPVFDLPKDTAALPLPRSGVLLTMIAPGSNAARSGLKPNDVLLRYHQTDLTGPTDLKLLPESLDPAKRVEVTVWREGKTLTRQVPPGKLGVVLASAPAPEALSEQRRLDKRLAAATRSGEWAQLPGTRVEVEGVRHLFADEASLKLLFDSQASEQHLYDLAKNNDLGQYRYVHLATHGEVNDRFPMQSAVILSRDDLPDAGKQLDAGLPVFTGRLTVDCILRHWNLKSELVTLSACQTALGKYERGEGYIGFAQALTLAGSRSVCLSLWKVDDAATALLMERFYQNLLGKREGLKAPLKKALALQEAKQWLRTLARDEAVTRTAQLSKGVERGKNRPVQPLLPPVPASETKDEPPYAHPYYWAAFILIGDPD